MLLNGMIGLNGGFQEKREMSMSTKVMVAQSAMAKSSRRLTTSVQAAESPTY